MDMEIKEVSLTGAVMEELIRLSSEWEAENSCYGYRRNEPADIEGNRIFIAEESGRIIGYLFGHTEKAVKMTSIMPDGTVYFEVEELYVSPAFRSQGIGRKLFRLLEQTVAGETEYLMLSTAAKNRKAILHFYLDELDMEFWSARLFKKLG